MFSGAGTPHSSAKFTAAKTITVRLKPFALRFVSAQNEMDLLFLRERAFDRAKQFNRPRTTDLYFDHSSARIAGGKANFDWPVVLRLNEIDVAHDAISVCGVRAAKSMRVSALTFSLKAVSVAKIGAHHSAGMLSRCHHFETADDLASISAAIASLVSQSSINARNEVICRVIPSL